MHGSDLVFLSRHVCHLPCSKMNKASLTATPAATGGCPTPAHPAPTLPSLPVRYSLKGKLFCPVADG